MSRQIVECVPNFSEGQDQKVIDAISEAIRQTNDVMLLDVDPGASTNRTVYTFVGSPVGVVEAALNAAKVAYDLIDMTKHKGEHPRMGALDVCPFIPVQGTTVERCVEISKEFGRRLAKELKVPVYLYGYASNVEYRKTMPQIRAGEYEGFREKILQPEWKPDFGEAVFVPRWGATVTGVRKFLIAYNVNILGTKEQAHRIALDIREAGRGPKEPGKLKNVQAIGWWLEEENLAQLSANITDHDITPIHRVFEETKSIAESLDLALCGSQIVGLVPLRSIMQASEYYMEKEKLCILDEETKVRLAIDRLGLSSLSYFDPKKRIIEYILPKSSNDLIDLPLKAFIMSVAARTPAPGGGSVAAAVAAMGSALGTMVSQLTYGKRQWEHLDTQMRGILKRLYDLSRTLTDSVDADTNAFNDYMEAKKLPSGTEEEVKEKEAAMLRGLKSAISVPLNLAKTINQAWTPLLELSPVGNINCQSDIQVAVHCLNTGVWGAYYNVKINLKSITDEGFVQETLAEINREVEMADTMKSKVLDLVNSRKE